MTIHPCPTAHCALIALWGLWCPSVVPASDTDRWHETAPQLRATDSTEIHAPREEIYSWEQLAGLCDSAEWPEDDTSKSAIVQATHKFDIRRMNLDQLTDDQLVDLYIARSQESFLRQSVDEAGLAEAGSVILQTGYTFTHDRDDLDFVYDTHTFPETLLRYRMSQHVELRVGWAGITQETVTDTVTSLSDRSRSSADPAVGIRVALLEQEHWIPRTALTVSTPVELRSTTNLANRFNPLATLSYSWLHGESWLVSGSSGFAYVTDGIDRFIDFQQAVSIDYLINDRWDLFAEWFALFPDGASGVGARHFAGPGVSLALCEQLQLGLSASFGLNAEASDLTTQLRLTWRP